MAVNYGEYRDIDMNGYDAVVVGAGFAGAVAARELAERRELRVLVIEKRDHIAGNMYDEHDEAGILVHRYGPHIFHTEKQRVFSYLRQFSGWIVYQHRVLADVHGTYLPVPFNENSLEIAFGEERAAVLIEKLVAAFGKDSQVTLHQLQAQDDPDLKEVADYVYENVFSYYTQKQWGLSPDEVDPEVIGRVPVRISRDDRYFREAYQGLPVFGYTKLFEAMLDHENITVCLGTEAESVFDLEFATEDADSPVAAIKLHDMAFTGPIVYTGPLDELFLSRFGRLPYRSLDFVYETYDEERKLPCGTVNYTVSEDYTRITEFKYLTHQQAPNTTIMKEYSRAYVDPDEQIPYYAILNDENRELHGRYRRLTETLPNFYPVGRLAEYRYYDMDDVVEASLDRVSAIVEDWDAAHPDWGLTMAARRAQREEREERARKGALA